MTTKIQYEIVAQQVEILYSKSIDNEADADKHCHFISEFILACGWDEDEFMERWLQEQEKLYPSPPQTNTKLLS